MLLRPILFLPLFFTCFLFEHVAVAEEFSFLATPFPSTISQEISHILNTKQNQLLMRANFEYRAEDVDGRQGQGVILSMGGRSVRD